MNSFERFTQRLKGNPVDRIPNFDIFMTRAVRQIGAPLSDYYLDYRTLVEANLAVVHDFQVDLVQAISDPYREAAGFGLQVEFPEDHLPIVRQPLLVELADLKRLTPPRPTSAPRMLDRLQAIRLFHEKVGGEIPIMGWVEGALAEACDLRGMSATLVDLIDHPEWVEELLEMTVETAVSFAQAQVEAGADLIGLGDAVCSQISPRLYRRFALPYEQRIFAAVKAMGAVPRLHICGNTTHLLSDMAKSGAEIIDLDWMVDLSKAAALFGENIADFGNFDPVKVMLQGTPPEVAQSVRDCILHGGRRSFNGAGCEIPEQTPGENLIAQYQALVDFS